MKTARHILASIMLLFFSVLISGAQNQEKVIGCWTMASRPGESIQLNRDGSFVFNDWNAKTSQFEMLYGQWKLEQGSKGKRITLYYDDRSKQSFSIVSGKAGSYMLTKAGGFRFTKAQPANCTEAQGQ